MNHAENKVKATLLGEEGDREHFPDEVEIISFPIAIIMVSAIGNQLIKRRFAEYEAKRISSWLRDENWREILKIAKFFNWRIRYLRGTDFALHFVDYLKNAVVFNEAKWKLVNRTLQNGEVFLSIGDVSRLLEEEIRRHIESKLNIELNVELPENLNERIESLKELIAKKVKRLEIRDIPKEVKREAFPPCIKKLYESTMKGLRISHIGRFTLTSFLLNIGLKPEEVINLFGSSSDFNERMTRYQVEHIAGGRGSRTRYVSPKCSTLQTHRLCVNKDDLCNRVRHPVTYYRRKYRMLMKTNRGEENKK